METATQYRTNSQFYTLTPAQAHDLSAQVLAILADHRGAQHTITGAHIAKLLGYRNDRTIRIAIQQLIDAGQPIAASVTRPEGYYLIQSKDEADVYEKVLRSRAVKTLKRLQSFHQAANCLFGETRQLPLFAISRTIEGLER